MMNPKQKLAADTSDHLSEIVFWQRLVAVLHGCRLAMSLMQEHTSQ